MSASAPAVPDAGSDAVRRCGFVALVGAPNAGKSTLLNCLVGQKLAIVTPKVQTTRRRLIGIVTEGAAQIIFVDTPGIFTPRRRLDRAMVSDAWEGASDADLVVLLVDAARPGAERANAGLIGRLAALARPTLLALNKIDRVRRDRLLGLAAALNRDAGFEATLMISALTGDGVGDLKAGLAARLPPGPWLYPDDDLTDQPMRQLAAEVTREKLFLQLQQELPYHITVETESWDEQADGSVRIGQVIYVQRDGHKAMVLGRGGARIKSIGQAARLDLESALSRRVHLGLFVKVRDWQEDPERYREIGLKFNG